MSKYIFKESVLNDLTSNGLYPLINGSPVSVDDEFLVGDILVLAPRNSYYFSYNDWGTPIYPYFTDDIGVKTGKFTVNNDGTATLTNTDSEYYNLVYSVTKKTASSGDFEITQKILDKAIAGNAEYWSNDLPLLLGDFVSDGALIELIANDGYFFYKNSVAFTGVFDNTTYFDISDDLKTATHTYKKATDKGMVPVISTDSAAPDVTQGNDVYLIDENKLKLINEKRVQYVSTGSDSTTMVDYGVFILSVLEIPNAIDNDLIMPETGVKLSTLDTGVKANKINTDNLEIYLGEINVPRVSNDLTDYTNTVAILHLPRIPSVTIDLKYVIGETIKINYYIDLYTGEATVNIYSSKINGVITTLQCDIGVNVPYSMSNSSSVKLDNSNIVVGGDNGIKTPFIELIKSNDPSSKSMFSIPVKVTESLSDQLGYLEVDKIDLQTNASYSEKETLTSILRDGIIIK